jgi:hypothetical protein
MRIQLDSTIKNELDDLCEHRGMTQIAVMSRLVDWFTKQDELIQTAILSALSEESLSQLAKQLRNHLEKKGRGTKKSVPSANTYRH